MFYRIVNCNYIEKYHKHLDIYTTFKTLLSIQETISSKKTTSNIVIVSFKRNGLFSFDVLAKTREGLSRFFEQSLFAVFQMVLEFTIVDN